MHKADLRIALMVERVKIPDSKCGKRASPGQAVAAGRREGAKVSAEGLMQMTVRRQHHRGH